MSATGSAAGGDVVLVLVEQHDGTPRGSALEPVSYTHLTLPTKRIV